MSLFQIYIFLICFFSICSARNVICLDNQVHPLIWSFEWVEDFFTICNLDMYNVYCLVASLMLYSHRKASPPPARVPPFSFGFTRIIFITDGHSGCLGLSLMMIMMPIVLASWKLWLSFLLYFRPTKPLHPKHPPPPPKHPKCRFIMLPYLFFWCPILLSYTKFSLSFWILLVPSVC